MPAKKSPKPVQRQAKDKERRQLKFHAYSYDPAACDVFAENLKRLHEHYQPLSYTVMAKDLGVNPETLRSYETRRPPNTPNVILARALANYFGGLTVLDLFDPQLDVSRLDKDDLRPKKTSKSDA